MAYDENSIVFTGNVAAEPEERHTQSGNRLVRFRVGNTPGKGDDAHTNWFGCVVFANHLADKAMKLTKGQKVRVFGRVEIKKGESQTFTDVVCAGIECIGKPKEKPAEQGQFGSHLEDNDEVPF